ncbi:glycosyltransferase family 2 protein [uncultured Helicobacter sp.]|uniref:glycosyltransferase family 2 protein n=1 Tax=uncultured Helicobacter sp. TaxID=175537 RepID=UPI00374F0547
MTDSCLHTLSIVIPCYNEKHTITQILSVVQNVNIPYHKEIIVVDDCSNDGTRELLQSLNTHTLSKQIGGGQIIAYAM